MESALFSDSIYSTNHLRCQCENSRRLDVSYYLSLNINVSGRIQYGAKLFARVQGRKFQGAKNNPVFRINKIKEFIIIMMHLHFRLFIRSKRVPTEVSRHYSG